MTDPQTPEEWKQCVNSAKLLLHLHALQTFGLIEGPEVNPDRCQEILERGKALGIEPLPIGTLVDHIDKWL